jgi:hypothetical protein
VNAMHRLLCRAVVLAGLCVVTAASGGESGVARNTPKADWSGVWTQAFIKMNIDGTTPVGLGPLRAPPPPLIFSPAMPWNDAARAKVQGILAAARGDPANIAGGAADGWGYPLMMIGPAPLQFVITPGTTLIINPYRDIRQVHTDGRAHLPAAEGWPSTTWGDSVGRWEADTLVIDTIGVRNPYLYFHMAAPLSDKAHYVERLRRVGPDRIEGELFIEDPATLTEALRIPLAYQRSKDVERMVFDSYSNDRSGFDGEFYTIEAPKQP